MVKIGGQKTRPNTLVSAASVRGRTLADKVYCATIHSDVVCVDSINKIFLKLYNASFIKSDFLHKIS